jgi:hypothetical protein
MSTRDQFIRHEAPGPAAMPGAVNQHEIEPRVVLWAAFQVGLLIDVRTLASGQIVSEMKPPCNQLHVPRTSLLTGYHRYNSRISPDLIFSISSSADVS